VALPFGSTALAGIVSKRLGSTYLGQLDQPLAITQQNNEKSPTCVEAKVGYEKLVLVTSPAF